jgi:hypothetical protein
MEQLAGLPEDEVAQACLGIKFLLCRPKASQSGTRLPPSFDVAQTSVSGCCPEKRPSCNKLLFGLAILEVIIARH